MSAANGTAHLYLNDKHVGSVTILGTESSWGYGEFHPNEQFSEFATLFGRWSLLMHADDDQRSLSDVAREELRNAEYAIDALHARLLVLKNNEWRDIGPVNIDGKLIEWKERFPRRH